MTSFYLLWKMLMIALLCWRGAAASHVVALFSSSLSIFRFDIWEGHKNILAGGGSFLIVLDSFATQKGCKKIFVQCSCRFAT